MQPIHLSKLENTFGVWFHAIYYRSPFFGPLALYRSNSPAQFLFSTKHNLDRPTTSLGVHWMAVNADDDFEPYIRSGSVFLLDTYTSAHALRLCIVYVRPSYDLTRCASVRAASIATFSRFIPTVKTRFDYGVTIFILTYRIQSTA